MSRSGHLLRWIAALALGGWMAALAVAAVKLDAWNDHLVGTLMQIRADATLRERMRQQGEPIPREWYRSKALALLSAAERLHDDTAWTLAIPGSWRLFDNLKERVGLRLERAFSEIAVETMRREIHFRAGQLTGIPLDGGTSELMTGSDCVRPPVPLSAVQGAAAPYELPEFVAVQDYLAQVAQLDQALQAMSALQEPGPADADNLRLLVRFTLGAELPGRLARSTGYIRRGLRPVEAAQAAISTARLQNAARCSLAKAMSALDARLFERNELLASEAYLAQRISRLLDPAARPGPSGEILDALREVVAGLDQQEALLAQGDYAWLHRGTPSLGPAHEKLLAAMEDMALLLGPEAVDQMRVQSGKALQRFRSQFAASFRNGGQPSLVWAPDSGRLVLSPERIALREGLTALLSEPFMARPGESGFPVGEMSAYTWDEHRLDHALALGPERRRFLADGLPKFPPAFRGAIARIVNAQVAQLARDRLIEAMSPADPLAALDAGVLQSQSERLAKVRTLLAEVGAREVKVPGSPSEP